MLFAIGSSKRPALFVLGCKRSLQCLRESNDSLRFAVILGAALLGPQSEIQGAVSENIIVNQIGYRTADQKVIVFSQPQTGQNAPSTFNPGSAFEIRRVSDDVVVKTGTIDVWKAGATHDQSGDKGWWGDFSALTTPGRYYVSVTGGSAPGSTSYPFSIDDSVYGGVLNSAVKTYYYQRCGTELDAAHGGAWVHKVCHVGSNQDTQCRLYDGTAQGSPMDVSGGWHDAGDHRKYVSFAFPVLWDLLSAYEWNPRVFSDQTGIPESGNGVPDILDEVKYELDFILKMQREDGAVHSAVGVLTSNNDDGQAPELSKSPRYVTNVNSPATSTLAMAASFASRLFSQYETAYPGYAGTLRAHAELSWTWLSANPTNVRYNHTNFAQAESNYDDAEDLRRRITASVELWRLTSDIKYKTYFENNYNNPAASGPIRKPAKPASDAFSPDTGNLGKGLVDYCLTTGANPTIVSEIKTALKNFVDNTMVYNAAQKTDLYRSYQWDGHYCWGSNWYKGQWGSLALSAAKLGVASDTKPYLELAENDLHYFLGVNPLAWVYLTNLGSKGANLGASKSIDIIYHSWFGNGTIYEGVAGSKIGPPPGYVSGGPNQYYAYNTTQSGGTPVNPPGNQPPQKSYRNWNKTWPDCPWSVTEPAIYYQASYIFVNAAFAPIVVGPELLQQPAGMTRGSPGADLALQVSVDVSGGVPSYQWRHNGVAISGNSSALTAILQLTGIAASDTGAYDCVVTLNGASSISDKGWIWVERNGGSNSAIGLSNLSSRSYVGTDGDIQIAGFVISGSASKHLLLRGAGPALSTFLSGYVQDPKIVLFDNSGPIQTADDWGTGPVEALKTAFGAVGAFGFPEDSKDSAMLVDLAPGNYTLQLSGASSGKGIALVEAYDSDLTSTTSKLTNISTRALVGSGGNALIVGFVIVGSSPRTVLVRAAGPALSVFGVTNPLPTPSLTLFRTTFSTVHLGTFGSWSADSQKAFEIQAAARSSGAFGWADGSNDAAALVTLDPGNYTANVNDADGKTGVAIVEVYDTF